MTRALDIAPQHLAIVTLVLRELAPANAKIWVFGSRARGEAKRASDLDLAIDAGRKLTLHETAALAEALDEAPLPYSVDVVDLHSVSEAFAAIIEKDKVPLPGFDVAEVQEK